MWYLGFPQFEELAVNVSCYLTGIGRHDLQPPIYRPEGLDRHQFLYCEKGSGLLKIAGREIRISGKNGFYIPAGVPHEYSSSDTQWDIRWISCGGRYVEELCERLGLEYARIYELSSVTALDDLLNRMRHEGKGDPVAGYYMASSYVDSFILEFCRQAGVFGKTQSQDMSYQHHFAILEDYIEQNYMRDVSLEELCGVLAVTPQHVCRIFKACASMRPTEYLNQIRLRHAKELLASSDYPIHQIARWCGYENVNYFGKRFKKENGMTPGQYRQDNRRKDNI